jgi:hypothetical protein
LCRRAGLKLDSAAAAAGHDAPAGWYWPWSGADQRLYSSLYSAPDKYFAMPHATGSGPGDTYNMNATFFNTSSYMLYATVPLKFLDRLNRAVAIADLGLTLSARPCATTMLRVECLFAVS